MPSHLPTVIKQNGIITTDKFKLVNHLNNHFVKVGCAFEDNPCIPTPSSINLAPTTRLPILAPPPSCQYRSLRYFRIFSTWTLTNRLDWIL